METKTIRAALTAAICVAAAALPSWADTIEWNGEAGNGSMSDGGNWVGGVAPAAGDTLNLSAITSATTLNADFGDDRSFAAVTMGTGVTTFAGSLTATSFSDYSKIAVGANSTVTITNNLSISGSNPKLCSSIAAGGKFRITGKLTIAHSGDFYFASTASDGAVVVEGGIVINTTSWVLVRVKSLVLGASGISFSKNGVVNFVNNCIVYSLGATTVLGTQGVGSYCGSNPITICTTQFESDQPATITFSGNLNGKKNYWAAATVTGCGKAVFTSASVSNRGLTVSDGATLAMTPGVNLSSAGGQSFTVNSGATLEVAAAGSISTTGSLSFADGSSLNIAAYSAGGAAVSTSATLTLPSSGTVNLTLNGGAFTPGVYAILSGSGVTEATGEKFTFSTGGETYAWSAVGNTLVLTVGTIPGNRWTGVAGDGSMANGNNWAGGSAPDSNTVPDFSGVTISTTINADIADTTFSSVTMGSGVIAFTGALTATSFSNLSKLAVGANGTVTIDNNLSFTGAGPKYLCNSVAAGGKLRITGTLYIAHSSGDFYFTQNNSEGAVVVDGLITINCARWIVLSAKALVLGPDGISLSQNSTYFLNWNNPTIYSLGASTVIGTKGAGGKYCTNSSLTFCTTQFESDQPATITFTGNIGGKSSYWNGVAVTGCGRFDFVSGSYIDRALTVSGGATVSMNPGMTFAAGDQALTFNSGTTLEVAASDTLTLNYKTTTINSGAMLGFNFTDEATAPLLTVASGKTSSLPATLDVKVTAADGVRPKGGKYTLTRAMDFTGKTVNLVDKPKWVKSIEVDEGGNLVLTAIPKGFMLIVK